MADMDLLQNIHRLDQEIASTKGEIKTVDEAIAAEVEGSDAWQALEDAKERVKVLKQQLKAEGQSNGQLAKLEDEKVELQFKLKDQKEILSHHLLQYNRQEDDTQVPLADGTHARQIIMSARLSLKEEYYQERIPFGKNAEVSVSDNKTKTTFSKKGTKTEPVKEASNG